MKTYITLRHIRVRLLNDFRIIRLVTPLDIEKKVPSFCLVARVENIGKKQTLEELLRTVNNCLEIEKLVQKIGEKYGLDIEKELSPKLPDISVKAINRTLQMKSEVLNIEKELDTIFSEIEEEEKSLKKVEKSRKTLELIKQLGLDSKLGRDIKEFHIEFGMLKKDKVRRLKEHMEHMIPEKFILVEGNELEGKLGVQIAVTHDAERTLSRIFSMIEFERITLPEDLFEEKLIELEKIEKETKRKIEEQSRKIKNIKEEAVESLNRIIDEAKGLRLLTEATMKFGRKIETTYGYIPVKKHNFEEIEKELEKAIGNDLFIIDK